MELARATKSKGKLSGEALNLMRVPPNKSQRGETELAIIREYLSKIVFFRTIPDVLLSDFCAFGVATAYKENDVIVQRGDDAVFMVVLEGKAGLMARPGAEVPKSKQGLPERLLFEGDCVNEGFLRYHISKTAKASPMTIKCVEDGTVVLRMSQGWIAQAEFFALCRVIGIDFANFDDYDKNTFLGKIPPRNLERLLRQAHLRNFSSHQTILEASQPADLEAGGDMETDTTHRHRHRYHRKRHESGWRSHKHSRSPSTISDIDVAENDDGTQDKGILYIAEGEVQVNWVFEDGEDTWYVPVACFGAGEVLGLLEMLYEVPLSFQIVSKCTVKTVFIPKTAIYQIPAPQMRQVSQS